MAALDNKIYKFRIIGNYDTAGLGSLGTALDNEKTKFLICEDVMEADDVDNPRHGFRYIVARPIYLWNATSPKLYTGSVYDGENPIGPNYSEDDIIEVASTFDDTVYSSTELTYSSDLKSYIQTFHSSSTPIMNWNEINNNSIIKCYFIDLNRDARTRELGGGSSTCAPVVVSSPNLFPPPGTKTAIVENHYLKNNHAMFCVESTEVLFQDMFSVSISEKITKVPIPCSFLAICENIKISSCVLSEAMAIGCSIDGNDIIIKIEKEIPCIVTLTLSGIRKGYNNGKYNSVSDKAKDKNMKFWQSWLKE